MTPGGARLMVGFDGTHASDDLRRVLETTGARSVIVFARNLVDARQTSELIAEIRALVPWPLLIAVDQEGGAVVRLTRGITVFPGNLALAATGSRELALAQGRASGAELGALGFDLNLAPVVDLQTNPRNPGIGIRSFGSDPELALALASEVIRGHEEHGVGSCLKHFPGKGAADVDAHFELPVIQATLEEFRHPHLTMFEQLIRAGLGEAVMTTHVVVDGIDRERPATTSPCVVRDLLRGELGFTGLVITDDLEMGAITGDVAEVTVAAAVAGHDLMPICHDHGLQLRAAEALEAALSDGRLDRAEHEAAIARIEALAGREPAEPIDPRPGTAVAAEIAERAVCVLGDEQGLLPVTEDTDLLLLAARPRQMHGAEDAMIDDFEGYIREFLADNAPGTTVRVLADDLSPQQASIELDAALDHDRVLLASWNARIEPGMRFLLEAACRTLADRLIVVHLRNPFDQALVDPSITAMTAFGYRIVQLSALAAVLRGRRAAVGNFAASYL